MSGADRHLIERQIEAHTKMSNVDKSPIGLKTAVSIGTALAIGIYSLLSLGFKSAEKFADEREQQIESISRESQPKSVEKIAIKRVDDGSDLRGLKEIPQELEAPAISTERKNIGPATEKLGPKNIIQPNGR